MLEYVITLNLSLNQLKTKLSCSIHAAKGVFVLILPYL